MWDLDHTVWDGILLEDGDVPLRPGVLHAIRTLDERGILQSVASRNDHDAAMARLRALGIEEYFLYPQINWNAKGQNVAQIAKSLNINLDTFLFVDDQPFEREEVQHACPTVRVLDAAELEGLLERPELNPEFITDDSRNRRRLYMADIQRNQAEAEFAGPSEDVPARPAHALHARPLRRGGPAARRRAHAAHQPAQHHRLHLRLRRAQRLSHLAATTC